jgi:uncharacterized membrane protein
MTSNRGESRSRSAAKALVLRVVEIAICFAIMMWATESIEKSIFFVVLENILQTLANYILERAWNQTDILCEKPR